jgi:3',5'-cyclic AMP phosphodiesterase CpdA/endonuclease/exonuclease/phosphatase family metal-dependent hydrolase
MSDTKLRVICWNTHCGVSYSGSPENAAQAPNVEDIISCVSKSEADIVCLQEMLFPKTGDSFASLVAKEARYDFYDEWAISPSYLGEDSLMGLAILSRHELTDIRHIKLKNPDLKKIQADGSEFRSHEKGLIACTVKGPNAFNLICGHLVPFYKFDRSITEPAFSSLQEQIKNELAAVAGEAAIVCCDFNSDDLSDLIPRSEGVASFSELVHLPTRVTGERHDNILCTDHWEVDAVRLLPTLSDHHLCMADLTFRGAKKPTTTSPTRTAVTTKILHLSDLHFGPGEVEDDDWKTPIAFATRDGRRQHLAQVIELLPATPDFVIVSGDITIAGRPDGLKIFNEVIDGFITDKKLPPADRFIVVPGNHDVTRQTGLTKGAESARWNTFLSSVGGRHVRPWIPSNDVNQGQLLDVAEQTCKPAESIWGGVDRRINKLLGKEQVVCLPFLFDRDRQVLFYAFNSASISGNVVELGQEIKDDIAWLREDKSPNCEKVNAVLDAFENELSIDPARISPDELELFVKIMRMLRKQEPQALDAAFKVAVLHHHIAPIIQSEEIKKFELLLNAGRLKYKLQQEGFHLVTHGHKHWPETFLDSAVSGGGSHIVISGGTICGALPPGKAAGFNWIEYDGLAKVLRIQFIELDATAETIEAGARTKALTFTVPTPGKLIGLATPAETITKCGPFDLRELYANAEKSLLDLLRSSRNQKNAKGWTHRIETSNLSMIATAYGLLILRLIDARDPRFLESKSEIMKTLMATRLEDGGWSASSQGNSGRPEATAWAILALDEWGATAEAASGMAALETMFENEKDAEARDFVFILSLVLRIVASIKPTSPLVSELADLLLRAAARDEEGKARHWSPYTFRDQEKWSRGTEPSALHTAHAMLALTTAFRASRGKAGLKPEELSEARRWLLEQPWENTQETIHRTSKEGKIEVLQVNHFTTPWVLMALLACKVSPSEPRVRAAVEDLAQGAEHGLWNWGAEKRPIWASYDALKALSEYALRTCLG